MRNTNFTYFSIITTEEIMKQVISAAAIVLMASSTAFAFVWSFAYAADYSKLDM